MKLYNINDRFSFGKHTGKTILEVIGEDIGYINWCLINLDHFVISEDSVDEIKKCIPVIKLSDLAEQVRLQKMNTIETETEADFDDDDYGSSGEKYGWYNGWSDDAIDDAFEGDPMNTWNVD